MPIVVFVVLAIVGIVAMKFFIGLAMAAVKWLLIGLVILALGGVVLKQIGD